MSRQVADAMPHSGERLVAETRLKSRAPAWPKYVLSAVAAVLVAVAVSAVLAAQTTSSTSHIFVCTSTCRGAHLACLQWYRTLASHQQ